MNNINPPHRNQNHDADYLQSSFEVLEIIADILEEIVRDNAMAELIEENEQENARVFITQHVPQISILDYLKRLVKYTRPEPSTLIIMLIYIDKVCENSNIQLSYLNIHKLILASLIVSIKYNEDDYYSNQFYARVGGISLREIYELEYELILLLDFVLFIDESIYANYESQLKELKN